MGFIKDLFNFQTADYSSPESLASDIFQLAEKRYDNLRPLLSNLNTNDTG
jgi:hypothetical protein